MDLGGWIHLRQIQDDLRTLKGEADRFARRVSHLQESFEAHQSQLGTTAPLRPPESASVASNESAASPPELRIPAELVDIVSAPSHTVAYSRRQDNNAELKIGQLGLLIVGIVVVVLGVGYFLKYAFDKNWIGPVGRVVMAYAGGVGGILVGELFRRKGLITFGLYLCGGGIAVLYFSGYAANQIYQLIDQPVSFGLMVAVTALAGVLAVRHDVMWLAVLGIIGGFLTPVVLSTGQDHQVALMTYMVILNGGVVGIAMYKRWGLLNTLGFIATWVLFLGWYERHYSPEKFLPTVVFLNVFFLSYTLAPFAYYFLRNESQFMGGYALTTLNGAISFGVSYRIISEFASLRAVSIATIGYSALYLFLAFFLRRRNPGAREPFALLTAMGALFLVITVPLLLSNHWITIFWSAQGLALVWMFAKFQNERLLVAGLALLVVSVVRFLGWDMHFCFRLDVDDMRYAGGFMATVIARWATFLSVVTFLSIGITQIPTCSSEENPLVKSGRTVLIGFLGAFIFLVLNIETAAWFHDYFPSARVASLSVLWAIFALVLMVVGFSRGSSALRKCSLALFGATLVKVFVVDMANVRTPYRIVSFLVLGVMLIGASFLYHRYRSRVFSE